MHLIDARVACNFFTRLKGLMFRKKLYPDQALLLYPCNNIHTFFMRFAIDVLFISKDMNIISFYKNVKPWRMLPPVKRAYYTLELPAGTIESMQF